MADMKKWFNSDNFNIHLPDLPKHNQDNILIS